jgi:hypothetical protein
VSKILKVAAIVVAVAAIIVITGGAAAMGIGTAGAAASAGGLAAGAYTAGVGIAITTTAATAATAATIGGISAATLSMVAGGLSIAANLTAARPSAGGSSTQFKADPNAGIPYVIGRTLHAGNIIYKRSHYTAGNSTPNLQTFVAILSGAGPIDAIESFASDKATVGFSGRNAVGGFYGWMYQDTQLGASPTTTVLDTSGLHCGFGSGVVTSGAPGWGGTTKLSGFAAAMWTLLYDKMNKFYSQGVPRPAWVLRGVRVYDPRLDSTYPGGSGACRATVESTYIYSENPYLHGLTYALGRYQNGARVIGVGAPIVGIDVAAYVDGANVADANGWKVGGVIYSSDPKWSTLKTILQAGSGEPMHLGAKLSCIVNAPKVTLATVTVDDVTGEVSVNGTQPRRDRINRIIPRYRSEAHDWQVIPAAPIVVAAHVTTDGGLRTKEVQYPLVQNLTQVSQLARYDIENAREFGPIALPLKLRWMGYKPGDQIAIVLPEVGLNGQTVVIVNRELDAEGATVTLVARSETTAKHAFALGQTGTAPPTPSVTVPPTAPTPGATNWAIAATNLTSGASVTPALVVTGATDEPVEAIVFDYRLWVSGQAADVGWIGTGAGVPGVARWEITALLPATAYEVAVSYVLYGLTGTRRILGPVTTSGGVVGTDNLIVNADLAVDTAGWTLDAGIVRTPGLASDPASYLQFQPGALRYAKANGGAAIPLNGATRLFWSHFAFNYFVSSGTFSVVFEWWLANGTAASTASTTVSVLPVATSVWTLASYETTPPADAVSFTTKYQSNFIGGVVNSANLRIARVANGADVTAAAQVVVTMPASVTYDATFTGTLIGSLTSESIRISKGGVSIKLDNSVSYAITINGSLTATVDTTNGSGTKGDIAVTAFAGNSASIDVVVTVAGVVQPRQTIQFVKHLAAAPSTGGTSSKVAYDTTMNTVALTTDVVVTDTLTVVLASGESLYGTAPLDFEIDGTTTASRSASGYWEYSVAGAGSWSPFVAGPTYVNSSTSTSSGRYVSGEWIDPTAGFISIAQLKSGLGAGSYDVRMKIKASGTGRTLSFYGAATIEAKV